MYKNSIGFSLIRLFWPCLLFVWQSHTQVHAQESALSSYQRALGQTVLLKNEGGLLPFQNLERLRVAVVAADGTDFPGFVETLGQYTGISLLALPQEDAGSWAKNQASTQDVFIFPIQGGIIPSAQQQAWNALAGSARRVAVLFDAGHLLDPFPEWGQADVLISTSGDGYGPSLAAQALFGGTALSGRLDKPLGLNFGSGAGMDSPPAIRLGYAPPELVGMDAQLLHDSISAIIGQGLNVGAYPGAQVLVARDGKVVYHTCFGTQAYHSESPVKKEDLYDLASVTKISSGLPVLMEWYGQGKLDLDAPLVRYLPEVKGSNKADIPMRRILTHTGRLMAWIPFWRGTLRGQSRNPWQKRWNGTKDNDFHFKPRTFRADSSRTYPVYVTDDLWMHRKYEDIVYRSMYRSPLNTKPGFVYSDFFFIMMPRVVRAQTGLDFETYVKDHFYRPLGATTITFNPLRFYPADQIIPTERDTFFRMKQLHGTVHDEGAAMLGGVSGHAGLFASVNDLAKLMQMYLNFGTYGGRRFIEEQAIREFIRCQYCDSEGIHRGLGFDKPRLSFDPNIATYAPQASASSYGHTGYTGTYTWMDPETRLLVIVCTNRVYPTRNNSKLGDLAIRRRVHEAAYLSMKKE